MKKIIYIAALSIAVSTAHAENPRPGGIKINSQSTEVGSSVNVAAGKDTKATTKIGTVGGNTSISGGLDQTTKVGRNVNVAVGKGTDASTSIGDIRNVTVIGGLKQTTKVGSNVNVAAGRNTEASTQIGIIGD